MTALSSPSIPGALSHPPTSGPLTEPRYKRADPRSRRLIRRVESGSEPPNEAERDRSRLDTWLGPFLTDSLLWPVGIVMGASLALFGSAILLLAMERNAFAWVTLLALLAATADGLRGDLRRRRLGPGGIVIVAVWALSILAAVAAAQLGLF